LAFAQQMKENEKAIIFCGRKSQADDLSSEFILAGIPCQCIHGSRDQVIHFLNENESINIFFCLF